MSGVFAQNTVSVSSTVSSLFHRFLKIVFPVMKHIVGLSLFITWLPMLPET